MSIVRWEPFGEIDSLFNRLLPPTFARWSRLPESESLGKFEWTPTADISETDKEYLIRAQLPAVKKDDVKVTVDDGMITIQGERKQQKEETSEKFHRVESFHGNFVRSFTLPDNVDVAAIRCEDKDGVLTVRLPKTARDKPRARQIKVE
jgi:HSP20 family protein